MPALTTIRSLPWLLATLFPLLAAAVLRGADDPPRSVDSRIKVELFAEHPQIHTPTGMDVDHRGRVWAIESNTHFRPEDYDGPAGDRLLIFTDADGDGRAEDPRVFAEGFQYAMSVAVRPVWLDPVNFKGEAGVKSAKGENGTKRDNKPETALPDTDPSHLSHSSDPSHLQVFLATRREILLLEDTDGDDVCDRRTVLVSLDTKGDYPHNGLAGFAFDPLGWMYIGLGENLGEPYRVLSREIAESQAERAENEQTADAGPQPSTLNPQLSPLTGGGEGGNIYRLRPDGTQLVHWATGFWNPHASCMDAFGHLFTVDNDPDSRPPCRLLHVIEGGDYGYKFRNGRAGLHPFTSWNGEVPGTLPMVAGTGEAPSGILAYEHDALPEEYCGDLLVTSWGDHRIERFRLKPKGASFESLAEPLIVGGENFRPVGIALAPDGSLFCTDWVLRDYQLHGQGRIWRISAVDETRADKRDAATIVEGRSTEELTTLVPSLRLDVRRLAVRALARQGEFVRQIERIEATDLPMSRRILSEFLWSVTPTARDNEPTPNAAMERFRELGEEINDPFEVTDVIREWKKTSPPLASLAGEYERASDDVLPEPGWSSPRLFRLAVGLIARDQFPQATDFARRLIADPDPSLRRLAVQWVAEEKLTELRPQVEAVLQGESISTDLFLATLAALDMLDGNPPQDFDKEPARKYVIPLLLKDDTPPAIRIQALRLTEPSSPIFTADRLDPWLAGDDPLLRLEAVRTLQLATFPAAGETLAALANDPSQPDDIRREAILGLSHLPDGAKEQALCGLLSDAHRADWPDAVRAFRAYSTESPAARQRLLSFAVESLPRITDDNTRDELLAGLQRALHAHRGEWPALLSEREPLPAAADDWRALLTADPQPPGDSAAGRRIFFHPAGPGCYKCHTADGRGGRVGPDLSYIGRSRSRDKLIDSILDPSREIAPQFTNWTMLTHRGTVHSGMIVHENRGMTTLGNSEGVLTELLTIDIAERAPQSKSVMPEKLQDRLTPREFRDLLAFLLSLGV